MSVDPQSQSSFLTRLPPEVRDAIYLELWRSCGLRQHIHWHGRGADKHFCRWSCTTDYQVEDELQRDIEEMRRRLGVSLGQDMWKPQDPKGAAHGRRLQSPWMNHWACGERAEQEHSLEAIRCFTTSDLVCWQKKNRTDNPSVPTWSPYLPMLLSCKLISAQCLKSIYESTTFVFTDMKAIQMFFGNCPVIELWPDAKLGVTPPGFYQYARTLELSLSPDFPRLLRCANFDFPGQDRRHDVYDFHWLRLDRFQKLHTLNIWISARSTTWSVKNTDSGYNYTGITEFDMEGLRKVLSSLSRVQTVTLSTPLGPSIVPEDGYVEDVGVRVYKRGAGDRFHPPLFLIEPGGTFDNVIHTSPTREVRLSCNGGIHLVMKEV